MKERTTKLPVTVLSGFLGSGKTTLLNRILKENHGLKIAVIVNDMAEVNIDAELIRKNGNLYAQRSEKLVEMQNGCICCTLREDLLLEVARLAEEETLDYLVIESTGISEPMPVAATFAFRSPETEQSLSDFCRIDTMVTVVDAHRFPDDSSQSRPLRELGLALGDDDIRTLTSLLVEQVEFADVIIVNKTDLLTRDEVEKVVATLRALNPVARIVESHYCDVPLDHLLNSHSFSQERARSMPGWYKELTGQHVPESEEYGVKSFVYRARRPFHPQRLMTVAAANWKHILRSKGFLWMANMHDQVLAWSQSGQNVTIEEEGRWWASLSRDRWPADEANLQWIQKRWEEPFGDRRQELVFIGVDLDVQELAGTLNQALLTDSELALGPQAWSTWDTSAQYAVG